MNDEPIKLEVKGWIESDEEEYTNVPKICPKCDGKLWRVDALSLCNVYMVGCKDSRCRWAEMYYLEG